MCYVGAGVGNRVQTAETTVTVPTSPVPQWTLGFLGMIFVGVIVILVFIFIAKYLKNWKYQPDEPFKSGEGRSILSFLSTKLRQRPILALGIIAIILVPTIIVVGRTPVHRTNIEHMDPEGDVEDSSIDIIRIGSRLKGTTLVLQMVVVGKILNETQTSLYQYNFRIVMKDMNLKETHIYRITYENGTLEPQYSTSVAVENNTLTVYFPISTFYSGEYMIGLEGRAQTPYETDTTESDRNCTIARLWF
ncbi:MAG: hypothetical protein ACOC38_02600 [Promethearchaeia archaeon]